MFRLIAALLACVCIAGCTTTRVKSANAGSFAKPAPSARGLLVQPDVQLAVLTAAGLHEARADWSRDAQANLANSINQSLKARSHPFEALDPSTSMEGRAGQLLRLNEAVGQSVIAFEYSGMKLPTKKSGFDWTLGDGALVLGKERGADYALFVTARGTYASAGRKAVMIGAALLGISVPLGSQQVFASLVDLRTGQLVWFNVAVAGPSADIRSAEGAQALTEKLLKDIPL
jgi:hypothetical protein